MRIKNNSLTQQSTLKSGVQIATRELPKAQSVAIGIFIDVGSRDEADEHAGIAHALEHMVFKGTEKLNVHQLAESLDALGGNANAFTSRERTCFHLHVLHEDWQQALALLSDMLLYPSLPETEWKREREVIFAEMSMVDDNPDEWVYDQHISQVYAQQNMGKPVLGSKQTLAAFSTQDLRSYLNQNYRGDNVLIAAAGRIKHQDLLNETQQSGWASSTKQTHIERKIPIMKFGQHQMYRQMEQAQMIASWRSVNTTAPGKPAAWVANQLLGGSMSSVLFREIREKRGLAYSIGSHLSMYTDAGLLSISCSTMPEQMVQCMDVLKETILEVCEEVPVDMIKRAQRQLTVQLRMGIDSVEGSMLQLGALLDENEVHSPLEWVNKVESVEPAQVQHFLTECLQADALWTTAKPKE